MAAEAHAWEADFAEYVGARAQALRRTAYALCGDWHAADDLVQSAFVRLYPRWRKVRSETADAYTRKVLVNLYLAGRRRRWRELPVAEPPDAPGAGEHDRTTVRVDLGRALATLSPRQRAVVVLRFLEDLPVSEVAELLGIAEGTVKSQTARGIESLRAALGPTTARKE